LQNLESSELGLDISHGFLFYFMVTTTTTMQILVRISLKTTQSMPHHDHIIAGIASRLCNKTMHEFDEAETIVSRNDGSMLSKMMQIMMP